MPAESMPAATRIDRPSSETLPALQARQAELIRKGQEVLRELDEVTAQIVRRQSNRDEATSRWKTGEPGGPVVPDGRRT